MSITSLHQRLWFGEFVKPTSPNFANTLPNIFQFQIYFTRLFAVCFVHTINHDNNKKTVRTVSSTAHDRVVGEAGNHLVSLGGE